MRTLLNPVPDIRRCPVIPDLIGHKTEIGFNMLIKLFKAGTQVIQTRLPVRCADEPVFRAFTVAEIKEITFPAITWQGIPFIKAKFPLTGQVHIGQQ